MTKKENQEISEILNCARKLKEVIIELMKDCRQKSLALTKLDEAVLWAISFYSNLE